MVIYKVTNLINGKIYIGQTVGSLKYRWNRHCSNKSGCLALSAAIKKYGKENFSISVIFEAKNRKELNIKEEEFISKFNSMYPNGYNLTTGGDSKKHSDITKQKLSSYIGPKNYHFGKPRTSEVKDAISIKAKIRGTDGTYAAVASRKKPIICVETGQIFDSISSASRNLNNIGTSNICKVLKGKLDKIGGFSFKYLE